MRVHTGSPTFPVENAFDPYLRVKVAGGVLVAADATDVEVGTLERRVLEGQTLAAVVPHFIDGTKKMVAAGAIAQYADVYGAAGGKISTVDNGNYRGKAMTAASGNGSVVEVLPLPAPPAAG